MQSNLTDGTISFNDVSSEIGVITGGEGEKQDFNGVLVQVRKGGLKLFLKCQNGI